MASITCTPVTDRNKGKVHVPAEYRRRVEAGGAHLTSTMPGWLDIVDLDKLDLLLPCACVLGQLVKSVDPSADYYSVDITVDRSSFSGQAELDSFDAAAACTPLPAVTMTHEQAVARGFHCSDNGSFLDDGGKDAIEFALLTVAWRQYIKRERKALAAKQAEKDAINAEWALLYPPLSLEVPAVLMRAADIVESDGWTQGAYCRNGAFCTMGAIEKAVGYRFVIDPTVTNGAYLDHKSVTDKKAVAVGAAFAAVALTVDNDLGIAGWNDTTGRTKAEVIAKLRGTAVTLANASALV